MAGGQGTRFWPVSRQQHPKQFLPIAGTATLLQQTVKRLQPLLPIQDIYVVCGPSHVPQVKNQLEGLGEEQIIVEPLARSTAVCIGLAALYLKERAHGEVMVVLPSDHWIQDEEGFRQKLQAGERLASEGWLVTFGIEPDHPATGYGYMQAGDAIGEYHGHPAHRVARFIEKPPREEAENMLTQGGYFWNSGMFLWSSDSILSEIQSLMPELGSALEQVGRNWDRPDRLEEIFSALASMPIDYGVMEKSDRVALLPCRIGWSDVGSWRALTSVIGRDSHGITGSGRYLNVDSRDCIVRAGPKKVVALVGVENLVVVDTPDALLVCSSERTEDVREVIGLLGEKDWDEYL